MKLRYQMRGLGIGIIVTALLMGVALDEGRPLSDAEIKLLATELGMVEEDSLKLSDVQQSGGSPEVDEQQKNQETSGEVTAEPTEVPPVAPTAEPTETPPAEPTQEPTETPTAEPTQEPTEAPTAEATEEPTPEPTAEPPAEPTREAEDEVSTEASITIVVKSGANSYSVSKQLAEAGLVDNASVFDKYLCSNGYAERIQVGTFIIPTGSSDEEIAKIITKVR